MKTILVIEDQPDMRKNIATILTMQGYAVLSAAHGLAGLALAREEKPDLILCDVMMPELDGRGVLQGLHDDRTVAGTPFIFLTAKGEKSDICAGMNLGADDYLTKPVAASDLLATIAARFSREQARPPASFHPYFTSAKPLEALGLTPRESEVLLWVAQGKSNSEISTILGAAENIVKKHLQAVTEALLARILISQWIVIPFAPSRLSCGRGQPNSGIGWVLGCPPRAAFLAVPPAAFSTFSVRAAHRFPFRTIQSKTGVVKEPWK